MCDWLVTCILPVIVNNLDAFSAYISPSKNDSPLIVYANAMHPAEISSQGLGSIPGRRSQILKRDCSIDRVQFPYSGAADIRCDSSGLA
jgi:hypothetical protein